VSALAARPDRARKERRRREAAQLLAATGLGPGPRRLAQAACELDRASRLRRALASLGPPFSSFGRYLASRPDLLAAADCLELSRLAERTTASPWPEVAALLARELDAPLDEVFAELAPQPFLSRWDHQRHHGRLVSGERVTVKLVHPELAAGSPAAAADLALLPWLAEALAGGVWGDLPWSRAVGDFATALDQRLDLGREAEALAEMAAEAPGLGHFEVPVVYRHLSTARVLTTATLAGAWSLPLGRGAGSATAAGVAGDGGLAELATRLAGAWLGQMLLGAWFPLEPTAADLQVCRDGRLGLTGGLCGSLPAGSKARIWDYLIAVAGELPDRACELLLAELAPSRGARGAEFLGARLRQSVTFRDGSFRDQGRDDTLGERLLLQLRLAGASGYRPSPALARFARGLAAVAVVCRRLAPDGDPFAAGLQELRARAALAGVWQALQPRELARFAGRQAALLLDLPQQLDAALTRAASGDVQGRRRAGEECRRRRNRTVLWAALGLTAAALCVLAPALAGGAHPAFWSQWSERAGAIAALLAGILALGAIDRT
jgi:ubiquinone biosynthesis protein